MLKFFKRFLPLTYVKPVFPSFQNARLLCNPPSYKFSIIEENTDASRILEEVEAKVIQTLRAKMKDGIDDVDRASTFADLGIDSLDAVDLVVSMEETLRVEILDEEALRMETVNDCIAIFHKYKLEKFNKNKLALKEEQKNLTVVKKQKRKKVKEEEDDE